MLIIKKLTKQCAPCPSASIMILQKGIAISLEGWHLVLTLLASILYIYLYYFQIIYIFLENLYLEKQVFFIIRLDILMFDIC